MKDGPISDEPILTFVNIIFDGPPSHVAPRFIETETDDGAGIGLGEWIDRGDGTWSLRFQAMVDPARMPPRK